ncbi:MAG: histidinol-phosphatase HisJ family protein [Candidatus Omnitrophica bacterium]|nr:histidinol-phosphatase HisJ family protein [Candidatus Omnitrophota bacterium]
MQPISDYHMHTPLCGHADGEPAAYAQHAVTMGLKEIGFSDHAPLFSHKDPSITMDESQLPLYHQMIEAVRKQFADQLTIRIGIEADFVPGYEDRTKTMLAAYPYDYVLGSVHFIAEWGFDDPIQLKTWSKKDVNRVYQQYYKLLQKTALSGLFDIMAHVDLVKKFDFHPTIDMAQEVRETAAAFKQAGVLIEINSSGLRKPVKEIYPSLHDLKIYREAGVPITFGSDAHKPAEVGQDFDKSHQLALAAGYKEYALLKGRKIDRTLPL